MSDPKDPYAAIAEPAQSDPYAAIADNPSTTPAPVGDTGDKISATPDSRNSIQKYIDNLSTVLPGDRRGLSPTMNAAQDFGAGVIRNTAGALAHPIATAKSLAPERDPNTGRPTAMGWAETALGPGAAPLVNMAKGIYQTFKGKPLSESIPDLAGQAVGGALTGEAVNAGIELAPRVTSGAADLIAGTRPPRVMKGLVEKTQAGNAANAVETAEANHAAALKHLEETQKALHETAGREMTHVQELKAAQDVALAKRKAQLAEHAVAEAKVEAERQAAQEKYESASAAQKRIAPTEQKLRAAWGDLRAGIETAREKALKVGNEQYSTVREALNEFPADMEKLGGAYAQAVDSFGEAGHIPPIIARMEKSLKEPLTYADEQTLYSELGKELSKGTLPGATFHAYDTLQDAIGDDMQRIADSQGMGAELTGARNYWRRMKQTFGKPLAMRDAASGTLKASASGLAAEDALQNQIRLLGSFDSDIPKQFTHVQNIEKGVESLPKPVPAHELTQKLIESRPPIPARPAAIDARLPAPPERVAPPDRPTETLPAPKKIGEEDVQAAKAEAIKTRSEKLRTSHSPIMSSIAIYDAIRSALEQNWKRAALDVGARAIYGVGKTGLAKVLENPGVIEYMSKATERDVASIPPDIRGSFPELIRQAQTNGIKVSPALLGIAATLPAPRENPTDAWQRGTP